MNKFDYSYCKTKYWNKHATNNKNVITHISNNDKHNNNDSNK